MNPTPYPDVNAFLARLLAEVRAILGPEFVGLYCYGSLASGDFDPPSSDVDFVVVTRDVLSPAALVALEAMHARLAADGGHWAHHLEGSYIPQAAFRRHDPAQAKHPTIGIDWPFMIGGHGPEWIIARAILRASGVVVAGPDLKSLLDPVGPDEIRAAVRASLAGFWAGALAGPDWLQSRAYQAFAVLTMCRALYTLEHGTLVSKPRAAAWALTVLPARWHPLIGRALATRADFAPGPLDDTLAFIRYTLGRAHGPEAGA